MGLRQTKNHQDPTELNNDQSQSVFWDKVLKEQQERMDKLR